MGTLRVVPVVAGSVRFHRSSFRIVRVLVVAVVLVAEDFREHALRKESHARALGRVPAVRVVEKRHEVTLHVPAEARHALKQNKKQCTDLHCG